MALKEYELNGSTFQFDEDNVPVGAVPVSDAGHQAKQAAPLNKQAKPANKKK